jgi:hypothetical protein
VKESTTVWAWHSVHGELDSTRKGNMTERTSCTMLARAILHKAACCHGTGNIIQQQGRQSRDCFTGHATGTPLHAPTCLLGSLPPSLSRLLVKGVASSEVSGGMGEAGREVGMTSPAVCGVVRVGVGGGSAGLSGECQLRKVLVIRVLRSLGPARHEYESP